MQNSRRKMKNFKTYVILTLVTAFFVMPVQAMAQKPEELSALKSMSSAFTKISEKASPAVVGIVAEKTVTQQYPQFDPFDDDIFDYFFRRQQPRGRQRQRQRRSRSQGSGVIISSDGYILTNNHVVEGSDTVTVKLLDGREFKETEGQAKVVGTDPSSEVAVIKIEAEDLPYLEMGNSDKLKVGEWVLAIGNPFGLSHTVTAGIVSAKGRSIGLTKYEDFIQTDAAINPGNSGGPLLDINGNIVGINTAIISQTGGNLGIGLAIPINMAKSVYEQLVDKGFVVRGFLGVRLQELTPELAKSFGMEDSKGALVAEVVEDSAAEEAGIKRGDVIIELNGEEVEDRDELINKIGMFEPGKEVEITILRDKEEITKAVELGQRGAEGQVSRETSDILKKFGMQITELTPELADEYGYKEKEGVLVESVKYNSVAAFAGIKPGTLILEIDREKVTSIEEFNEQMKKAIEDGGVLLLIQQGDYSRYVYLEVPKD